MKYSLYAKPYQTASQLVQRLIDSGLIIDNRLEAETSLQKINYFRFKIYLRPFLDPTTKRFKANSNFQEAYELYRFDDELRDLLFSFIGRIEIKLRSKLDQAVTRHTNNPFWYLDDVLFSNKNMITNTRISLKNEFLRSKDDFVLHYKQKYFNDTNDDFKEMPPFWIASELATFGNILSIFDALDKNPFKLPHNQNELDNLAKQFGAINLKELNSWLKLIRDVRNRCAHHSRTWNCNYREPSGLKTRIATINMPVKSNKLYFCLILLEIIEHSLGIGFDIKNNINMLLNKYTSALGHIDAMGMPKSWLK